MDCMKNKVVVKNSVADPVLNKFAGSLADNWFVIKKFNKIIIISAFKLGFSFKSLCFLKFT